MFVLYHFSKLIPKNKNNKLNTIELLVFKSSILNGENKNEDFYDIESCQFEKNFSFSSISKSNCESNMYPSPYISPDIFVSYSEESFLSD